MKAPLFSRSNNPFALTSDPRFAFPSSSYQAALERLRCGLVQRVGPMLLIGPAGCGKSMLLRALQIQTLQDGGLAFLREFFPFNPNLRSDPDTAVDDLMSSLLTELRHEPIPSSRAEREQALGQHIDRLPPGAHTVLLLDDAHRFDESDRDLILLPRHQAALQVILAGRPDLVDRYDQLILANHVDVRTEAMHNPIVVEIEPLTADEIAPYVAHRLAVARMTQSARTCSPQPFGPAALERVFTYSKGVPRTVNRLCACALSTDPHLVDAAAIDAAALECGLAPLSPHGVAAAEQRKSARLPHDRAESGKNVVSSATARPRLLRIAPAFAAALGLVSGVFYVGYLAFDGVVATALTRHERPAPRDIVGSETSTKPPAEVALPAGTVDTATEPGSGSGPEAEALREPLSSSESALNQASASSASERGDELLAKDSPQHLASPQPDGADSIGASSDELGDVTAPMVTDATDADIMIGSEPPPGDEALVDGMLDGPQAGGDLLSSAQESASVGGHEAEQPALRTENAETQSAAVISLARTDTGDAKGRAEPAPEATRPDRPPADLAPSGALEPQTTRAPAQASPQSAALDAGQLVARGYSLFDMGDPASARLFFERAAIQGHAGAMLAAGETFDPLELQRRRIIGVHGEPNRALDWYRRSAEAGEQRAGERLARLNDWVSRRGNQR